MIGNATIKDLNQTEVGNDIFSWELHTGRKCEFLSESPCECENTYLEFEIINMLSKQALKL